VSGSESKLSLEEFLGQKWRPWRTAGFLKLNLLGLDLGFNRFGNRIEVPICVKNVPYLLPPAASGWL
jgi:hypothetical protein